MYAAFNDGSVHVYDIDDGHRQLKAFDTAPGVSDVGSRRGSSSSYCPIPKEPKLEMTKVAPKDGLENPV